MIQTLAQRLAGFEQIGLDAALVLRFDRALSLVSPEEFIQRILIDCLHVANHSGRRKFLFWASRRRGCAPARRVWKAARFRRAKLFRLSKFDGQVVSSTAVRNAIAAGNVADAIRLARASIFAHRRNSHREPGAAGRSCSLPSIWFPEQELLPKLGVYATESILDGKTYSSVTNVGTRPTFDGQGVTVESHLFGFDEQITGGPMEVRFPRASPRRTEIFRSRSAARADRA